MREPSLRRLLSLWCSAAALVSVGVVLHALHQLWELQQEGKAVGIPGLFFVLLLGLSLVVTGLFAHVISSARSGPVPPKMARWSLLVGLPCLAPAFWLILR
jgi:predicted tellurium resistance membrane protein TerC